MPNELNELANSTEKERANCSILRGDVFLTRTSETMDELGMSCVALRDYENTIFNGFTKRLRPKHSSKIVPEYAAYFFRSPKFRSEVTSMSSLSTRASLNNEMLGRLKMTLPSVIEQTAIGKILKSLDDKIELNRQMNETLEAMARAIFKNWFVDFDPVRACRGESGFALNLPPEILNLFPDSFKESELGEIPKGWETKSLDEVADFPNGLACQKFPSEEGKESLHVIKIRELRQGITANTDRATTDIPDNYIVEDGDVLFSWSGSLLVDIWTKGRGVLNQHLFKVTSDNYPKWFFYYWTERHLFEFQRIAAYKATTMGHIKRHHLSDAKAYVPKDKLMQLADEQISPLFELRIQNELISQTLSMLRDTLLPKLISGELRVPDAEKFVEEAVV